MEKLSTQVIALTELKELERSDFNKIKEKLTHRWKKDEYRKIRSDLELILEGQKRN
jgi:hypothetical protein